MLMLLRDLQRNSVIRPLDEQFARYIHSVDDTPLLALMVALVSYELGKGNPCVVLKQLVKDRLFDQKPEVSQALMVAAGEPFEQWESRLLACHSVVSNGNTVKPMVLDNGRLYLFRYWEHERLVGKAFHSENVLSFAPSLARQILNRLFQRDNSSLYPIIMSNKKTSIQDILTKWLHIDKPEMVDWKACKALIITIREKQEPGLLKKLDQLVPQKACLNWQKIAAALAITQKITVISGGPGTGKTTTVARLLALLVELGEYEGQVPDIVLSAPTGKAAARLTESIGRAREALNCSATIKALIPSQANTIHRLLGVRFNDPSFRHNAGNPLNLDVLVVDEASMVDLSLMRKLLEAVPTHARIIFLGDKDQLASVEAGSVLGDVCEAAKSGYSSSQIHQLEALTGFQLPESVYSDSNNSGIGNRYCLLRKSYRFDATSGIGQLAAAINQGDKQKVKKAFSQGFEDIAWRDTSEESYLHLLSLCVNSYTPYLSALHNNSGEDHQEQHRKALQAFGAFRLLCALHSGSFGVDGLNIAIEKGLAQKKQITLEALWYIGRPVLITRNSASLRLSNGDIGITVPNQETGRLHVVFEQADGTLKYFLPSRLPDHQTVYAMTIHKSQGSEFDHTAMILPEQMNPVLTRELVYTGVTRAKSTLDLYAHKPILYGAIGKKTLRSSGLQERLLANR